MHIMTNNILKKVMTNSLAVKFSWAGMKQKLPFKDLGLSKIIIRTFVFIKFNILIKYMQNIPDS